MICIFRASTTVHALDMSSRFGLETVNISGYTSFENTYPEGKSKLEWPIYMTMGGFNYSLEFDGILSVEFTTMASPWRENSHYMKDYDWLDESFYPGKTSHEGLDVYSESNIDVKGTFFSSNTRLSPIRWGNMSLGFVCGYTIEEFDFRAYNTRQSGFGSWQDQNAYVSGPTATYTVKINQLDMGISYQADIDNRLHIRLDTSIIPYVKACDEDNHLKRFRTSKANCTGYGAKTSMSARFNLFENWYCSTKAGITRISTRGSQEQLWYGDDPASPNYDDTGNSLSNILTRIEERSFAITLGLGNRF